MYVPHILHQSKILKQLKVVEQHMKKIHVYILLGKVI